MDRMTAQDLRHLLRSVGILNESLELSTLAQRTLTAVNLLLPNDMLTYNEIDLATRADRVFVSPSDVHLQRGSAAHSAFLRHMNEHPLISHCACVADPVPRKISDFLSIRQFTCLGLYSEFFRLFGLKYQMALVIHRAGKQIIGIAANRRLSDFTERERSRLAALRPHVIRAYRNALCVEQIRARPGGDRHMEPSLILTQREAEILQWVSLGKSNDDVARIVGTASGTVKKHLEHVYAKLGVSNRTAASQWYSKVRT